MEAIGVLGVASVMIDTKDGDSFIAFVWGEGREGAICVINVVVGGVFGLWLCVERGWDGLNETEVIQSSRRHVRCVFIFWVG